MTEEKKSYEPGKRCLVYCGNEQCNCDRGPMNVNRVRMNLIYATREEMRFWSGHVEPFDDGKASKAEPRK